MGLIFNVLYSELWAPKFRLPVSRFPRKKKKIFKRPSLASDAKSPSQGHLLCVTDSYVLLRCQSINCSSESSYNISAKSMT